MYFADNYSKISYTREASVRCVRDNNADRERKECSYDDGTICFGCKEAACRSAKCYASRAITRRL